MIAQVRAAIAGLSVDDMFGWCLIGLVVLLVAAFPRQVRRSLLRWVRDEPQFSRGPQPQVDFGHLMSRVRRLVRPTLLLVPAEEPRFSKLGGDPELPEGVSWPPGHERPRTFLCQLDLQELPQLAIDWLPMVGRLYAFYDADSYDLPDVVSVLYSVEAAGPSVLAPKPAKWRFPERRVDFRLRTSAPGSDWLGLNDALSEDQSNQLEALGDAPPPDEVQHRIGGYPNEIQPERMWLSCEHLARGLPDLSWDEDIPPNIERAAKEWRLLLQIDSDPALKMNFGDGGRLYVFIRERHARRGDFSKTVTLWQTY